ncbi:5-methylthioadenosine-S-adenosylhomocysteine deaminase protein [Salinisphaera shabanensis E1L3A]|uniref:5-methylthioadenosine-S-adenosylhomocysteine deaminase protein n=1 Tax=Salinisphaera shabanensis E1L3A TaxID=1033802 RepID=U2EN80_9GAMM|nr:amidohydrolase family protein [Salinisphaera shabanensis]ERJ19582.1 5-methylthioadenosine-S-adenosylhomocysteine deaminase protein [Salinisphaera shabanensis E1L3A]
MSEFIAHDALLGAGCDSRGPVRITHDDGRITAIEPLGARPAGPRRLVMPCFANAHDHGRPLPTVAFGAVDKPLETWLLRLAVAPSVDPYIAACASFGRAALGGSGAVMMHCTRAQGLNDLPTEVAAVARAADTVGIRAAFAVGLRDRNPLVYGDDATIRAAMDAETRPVADRYFNVPNQSIDAMLESVDACAEAVTDRDLDVQYGPTGVQWCSDALLAAIAQASADTGRRVHMHLLETRYQREWADRQYPNGIVQHLAEIGLLGPRLTLAHCVWARDDELERIAESGATIAVNTSSNLHLRSGIAPLRRMLDTGCRVALGLDGSALDQDDDALREMRLTRLVHADRGFESWAGHRDMLACATSHGRVCIGAPGDGRLAAGQPADWLVLDLARLQRYDLVDNPIPASLFSHTTAAHIDQLWVGGQPVVCDAALVNLDIAAVHDELIDQYRRRWTDRRPLQAVWSDIEAHVHGWYQQSGCC